MRRVAGLVVLAVLVLTGGPLAAPARAQDIAPPTSAPAAATPAPEELLFFWGDGCPHCESQKRFLDELERDAPDLTVRRYEVWYDEANRDVFRRTAAAAGVDAGAVPTTFFAGRVWVGYSDRIGEEIRAAVEAAFAGAELPAERATVDVPFVGAVDVGDRSLVVSTLIIGFVDGINPCSLWVLSILLALVLHSGSRRRVLLVGGTFLTVTSGMYGLYIAGAYSVLAYAQFLPWIQRMVAVVVGAMGVLQLKDAAGVASGPSLSVPDHAKPGLYVRMRGLAASDRPTPTVLGATALLALGVSLLETPCTLGLPILWTSLLNQQDVAPLGAAVLFVVYLGAFLLDELIVFGVAVVTMRAVKLQEHHGQALKLISGVVMVTLALVMGFRPEWMESVTGALGVFAAAAAISAVGWLALRTRRVAV
jgi:cytochrome c biogenesis protein CcdA/thiol-disulfide isomerase/thioredoxin